MSLYGMPSLIELKTIDESVALCRELGLSFLELNTNFPNQQLHRLDAVRLNELARDSGIFYTIHLNDELYVADFSPHVSRGYCDAVVDAISFAQAIGAPILNMHLCDGARYTMPDRRVYFYEAYESQYLENIVRFRDLCTKHIADSSVRICIENTGGYLPFQQKALHLLLESPAFGLTLDVGHNDCAGGIDELLILKNMQRLHHLHLHDTCGKQDHLPLGDGALQLDKYLDLAQNRTAVVEVKTVEGLRRSLNWLNKK